ncbi:hypothetical protein [Calothrix sp. NIES-2098]|uniref:hypothetical protein n=1 Tax=Calothrix sp. NIES-2098 TaxID=1954171 RepID=UPI000B5EF088|nr:hypothetical protein NIES2098_47320 [Calothrix sp. NIES-2098]
MPRKPYEPGSRKGIGGRPKKYGEDTKQVRVPASIAPKLDDLYLFLAELDAEIQQWEQEINEKDIAKNPRYSKAKVLAESIREKISALGIDIKSIAND